jgi:hypothetical protein
MTKLLLLAGLLALLGMALIVPGIVFELVSRSAPTPTVDPGTPPRRYEHQAYVQFQTPQGPRVGYIEDFFWSDRFQSWSYDIQNPDGVVFENVLQKDITGGQGELIP